MEKNSSFDGQNDNKLTENEYELFSFRLHFVNFR